MVYSVGVVMMNKYNKIISIVIGILLTHPGLSINNQPVIAGDKKMNGSINQNNKNNKLFNNKNWFELCKIWKCLNKVNQKVNNINLDKDAEKFIMSLKDLLQDKMLTQEQYNFLYQTFSERLSYLRYKMGFIKCYEGGTLMDQIVLRREDLEERYTMLENLYSEGKINPETYKQTKNKILKDINFIEDKTGAENRTKVDEELVTLIIELNK